MKNILLLSVCLFTVFTGKAQAIVTIPDANFKAALIALGVDTNNDKNIQVSEAQAVGTLYVNGKGINDLTGIEAFSTLRVLNCSNNRLSSLNLTNNRSLYSLNCESNVLTILNVSNLAGLFDLQCSSNQLTSLNLFSNPALNFLVCSRNKLSLLDLSSNTKLTYLECNTNKIDWLGLQKCTLLYMLLCYDNMLNMLDLTNNTSLKHLDCSANHIQRLDLRSCPNLTRMKTTFNIILTQICITSDQFKLITNDPGSWTKDSNSEYNVGCLVATDIEEKQAAAETRTLVKVCTLMGEEVTKIR